MPSFTETFVGTINVLQMLIETYGPEKWDWSGLSINPNITFEFIEKYSEKLYFAKLSANEFLLENRKNKKKETIAILEKEQTLPKLVNLHIVSKYM